MIEISQPLNVVMFILIATYLRSICIQNDSLRRVLYTELKSEGLCRNVNLVLYWQLTNGRTSCGFTSSDRSVRLWFDVQSRVVVHVF